ncbi:MAG: TM2 domain-containing protein [Planctomycetota bacterium]|mgnify:CR=1 FL=1|nr:TM2 domain-containing protein [Planctomycetota bacterium]MEC8253565.1 TM2 domain-containing protein [Planctomycetota bacterium]MEC8651984.1 TM2 domain-containing protein [Planctomycetota bacterium]MEC9049100.1 TM2 domain-containing protein [Planctomycetota bacterium]
MSSVPSGRVLVGVLAVALGGFGVHRFVLGDPVGGILRFVISVVTFGFGYVIGFVEGIHYLLMSDEDFVQRYVVDKQAWF